MEKMWLIKHEFPVQEILVIRQFVTIKFEARKMLKSYEAFYDNGKLKWLGIPPHIKKAKVIVVVEEEFEAAHDQSSN